MEEPKRGRGTSLNPTSRFVSLKRGPSYDEIDNAAEEGEEAFVPQLKTQFLVDSSRSIVTRNDSPDVGFQYSVNPYRGCEHGCVYCYARPTHEYFGLSAGEDFESKILVKEQAPELLREALMKKSRKPALIAMSGVTDCYQPVERKFQLTRRCIEVLSEFRNPVFLITKNHLVTRDIDLLAPMAKDQAAMVMVSVTTLDADLCATLEPRTSRPSYRLKAIRELSQAGIPVAVNVAPVIPGLTDEEIPRILEACYRAGARWAGYNIVRLPFGVKDIFSEWAHRVLPDRAEKILSRIREIRGGKLNEAEFGARMRGQGIYAEQIHSLFKLNSRKLGFGKEFPELSVEGFQRPGAQLSFL